MSERTYFVYILTNPDNLTNYTGVTNDLAGRVYEHKTKAVRGFAEKYNIDKLAYFEHHTDIHIALLREKEIKGWRREKKLALVRTMNPEFRDLYVDLHL